MGILSSLSGLCFGNRQIAEAPKPHRVAKRRRPAGVSRRGRQCQVEALEPRELLAASSLVPQVVLGSVYFESDSGDDSLPNILQVSFKGGAAGTTLDRFDDQLRQAAGRPHGRRLVLRHRGRRLGFVQIQWAVDRQRQWVLGRQRARWSMAARKSFSISRTLTPATSSSFRSTSTKRNSSTPVPSRMAARRSDARSIRTRWSKVASSSDRS